MLRFRLAFVFYFFTVLSVLTLFAQDLDTSRSQLRAMIERYTADRALLNRSSPIDYSPAHNARMKQFYSEWLSTLDHVNFDSMGQDGRIDYLLFKNQIDYQL